MAYYRNFQRFFSLSVVTKDSCAFDADNWKLENEPEPLIHDSWSNSLIPIEKICKENNVQTIDPSDAEALTLKTKKTVRIKKKQSLMTAATILAQAVTEKQKHNDESQASAPKRQPRSQKKSKLQTQSKQQSDPLKLKQVGSSTQLTQSALDPLKMDGRPIEHQRESKINFNTIGEYTFDHKGTIIEQKSKSVKIQSTKLS